MLNILGLVRKPSTDESSLDRALSDSEGLPDSKTEQPQPAASSEQEPPKQESSEVPSSGVTSECRLKRRMLIQSFESYFIKTSQSSYPKMYKR
jgi:hypothetical protein